FCQAEDGIRDWSVTGVQTCALPIWVQGGATTMLPTDDAEWVGAELTRRFGLERWSFSLTATDANRWAIRLARAVTGRPKILVNRSEERRVGKEGRGWGSRGQEGEEE